jgi:hypothetical protein
VAYETPKVEGGYTEARAPGAPEGERNRLWQHGGYTAEAAYIRHYAQLLLKAVAVTWTC